VVAPQPSVTQVPLPDPGAGTSRTGSARLNVDVKQSGNWDSGRRAAGRWPERVQQGNVIDRRHAHIDDHGDTSRCSQHRGPGHAGEASGDVKIPDQVCIPFLDYAIENYPYQLYCTFTILLTLA